MMLVAVVGDMTPGREPSLPRFPGRKVVLQFWGQEPPSSHPDVVAVGPEDSTSRRWQEHGRVAPSRPPTRVASTSAPA